MTQVFKKWIKDAQSIKQRFEFLAEKSLMSDFKFIVGTDKIEVPAHKFIFSATSFEFYNLFFLSTPTDVNIYLEDIDYESFKEFIRYVYADDIQIGSKNFFDIFTLSLRYDIKHLTNLCLKELPKLIEEDVFVKSFMDFFEVWSKPSKDKISDIFFNIIGRRPLDFINEKNVIKLKLTHLAAILNSQKTETLEVDYFKLAMMWAEQQCILMKTVQSPAKNRTVLKNVFFLIRFPVMTLDEFHQCSSNHVGLFTNEEIQKIFLFIRGYCNEQIDFPLMTRTLFIEHKTVLEKDRSKIMLANLSNISDDELMSGVNSSRLDLFVEKTILLHGVNILLNPQIMNCLDKNIKLLTININISGGSLSKPLLHISRMDIPTTFTGSYLEKFVRIEDQLRLPFSEKKYSIFVKVTCSDSSWFPQYEKFLNDIKIESADGLNGMGIFTYDKTQTKGTAISNILFSLDKIKLKIMVNPRFRSRVSQPKSYKVIVEVNPFETLGNIKKMLEKTERAVPINQMTLLFYGNYFRDDENIDSLGIESNSVISLLDFTPIDS